MTDTITRARKEWTLYHFDRSYDPLTPIVEKPVPCPPKVVAALLDVLDDVSKASYNSEGGLVCTVCEGRKLITGIHEWRFSHEKDCKFLAAEAAITRALEGK